MSKTTLNSTEFDSEQDPFALFESWFNEAKKSEPSDPNAMSVATADKDGQPNVRILLLKGIDENGFVFYTNKNSHKGQELADNPKVALCFYWKSLERQVRVRGQVKEVSPSQADDYFASRPRLSQIGAHASQQSSKLDDYPALKSAIDQTAQKFADGSVPRPPHWSGFCLAPTEIEFWQAMPYRHHKRRLFTRQSLDKPWQSSWLYP